MFLRRFAPMALLMLVACTPAQPATESCPRLDSSITLPADDRMHTAPTEWWYWTGHVADEQDHWYGFQVTFFTFAIGGSKALLANVALTDVSRGVFHHQAAFSFSAPNPIRDGFRFELGPGLAEGGNGHDHLRATMDAGISFELNLEPGQTPTLQHGDGREDYSVGGYTYYYSRTRMAARGSLTFGETNLPLQGQAWFDHQWGELDEIQAHGWDWFALQLDDGRDVMLFLVHGESGTELAGGTITDSSGCARELKVDEVQVTAIGYWTSPVSHCTYPQGWNVVLPGLELQVNPVMADQELYTARDPTKTYWEGASMVTGTVTGRAYVELTAIANLKVTGVRAAVRTSPCIVSP